MKAADRIRNRLRHEFAVELQNLATSLVGDPLDAANIVDEALKPEARRDGARRLARIDENALREQVIARCWLACNLPLGCDDDSEEDEEDDRKGEPVQDSEQDSEQDPDVEKDEDDRTDDDGEDDALAA